MSLFHTAIKTFARCHPLCSNTRISCGNIIQNRGCSEQSELLNFIANFILCIKEKNKRTIDFIVYVIYCGNFFLVPSHYRFSFFFIVSLISEIHRRAFKLHYRLVTLCSVEFEARVFSKLGSLPTFFFRGS